MELLQIVILACIIGIGTTSFPNTIKFWISVLFNKVYCQNNLGFMLDIVWYILVSFYLLKWGFVLG